MDIENQLRSLKKVYQETEPSRKFLESGWQDLQDKISHLEKSKTQRNFYLRPFAFATLMFFIIIVISGGLVQASQKALPGEPLYTVKRFSEDVTERISDNQVNRIENRANEIVELSRKGRSSKDIQKAVEEYKEIVNKANRSGRNRSDIEQKLKEHEKEFEQIKQGRSEKEIDEAIEISRSGRGEGEDDREEDRKKDGGEEGKD